MTLTFARGALALAAACLASSGAHADLRLEIDASAPAATPTTGHLQLGSARAPGGQTLAVNNQYLLKDGQPWLPVMGEFHYSRSPASRWAAELQKMKAAGVTVVASYVIWSHHEASDGHFDWQGNRDLHRFLQLAQAAGLKAVVRIGPWSHAEVRYGGIPDWVVDAEPTRGDDPAYLRHVARLYAQIGQQLKGQLWKDGGPVIAIQIENEYNLAGPGQGAGHIHTLKGLALQAGLDVPLYTVTGWDGTVYPSGEVTPVFGGYPDEPWGTATAELPPKETYAFRFDSRVSGDLGAQTAATAPGTAETDIALTPFLGAEYGAGLPSMYRRRTLVSPDDIASMLPVQLGSGVNLLGYYMFHGGRNPLGLPSMQESTASGGYNDTPRISYDFQAPLGPDGQERAVLRKLRPFHHFLAAYGAQLAPMTVRKPARVPAAPTELATPRWAVRARGDSGFLFVNNHVRQYAMPEFADVRFVVRLPGGTLTLPQEPTTLHDGDYFVWPLNLDLGGTRLVYATAQPLTRLELGAQGTVHVFSAAAGQPAEMAFAAADAAFVEAPGARRRETDGHVVFSALQAGTTPVLTIRKPGKPVQQVLLLTAAQAESLVVGEFAGRTRLLLSAQQLWPTPQGLELRSAGEPRLRLSMFPAPARTPGARPALHPAGQDGLFAVFEAQAQARAPHATVTPVRAAQPAPPLLKGGLANAALEPIPEAWRSAASWRITLAAKALDGLGTELADVLLDTDFAGDMGRLHQHGALLDDWYFTGQHWQLGLADLAPAVRAQPLELSVLPLRADAPIYLPREHRPEFAGQAQVAALRSLTLIPVYQLHIAP